MASDLQEMLDRDKDGYLTRKEVDVCGCKSCCCTGSSIRHETGFAAGALLWKHCFSFESRLPNDLSHMSWVIFGRLGSDTDRVRINDASLQEGELTPRT